jgi:hypothetical protein
MRLRRFFARSVAIGQFQQVIFGPSGMQIFYFNISESGVLVRDLEGLELSNIAEARLEALKGARSLLAAAVREGRLPLDDAIVVTDEAGRTVVELSFGESVGQPRRAWP